jgi:vancomycin resistance protein YoaR
MAHITTPSLPKKILSFLLAGIVQIIFLIYIAYHLAYINKIYPGIKVAGSPVGNLTHSQAVQLIEQKISQTQTPVLTLGSDSKQWEINLDEMGFRYQVGNTVEKAFDLGRSKRPFADLKTKIFAWAKGIDLDLDYQLDEPLLKEKIKVIGDQIFIPPIEPTIKPTKQQVVIEPGKNGRRLEEEDLVDKIKSQLANSDLSTISLPINNLVFSATPEQIENTKARAENLIGKRIILTTDDYEQKIEDHDLVQLLSFTNGFNQEKLVSWASNLSSSINRPPENATFRFAQGKVVGFRPARDGKTLNEQKTIDLIAELLEKLENKADKEADGILPVETIPPAIKTADVNRLGIQKLIGKGVSYFRGSITSRIHNIQLASSKINGLLVAPGETFSFNSSLGEVSKETGFEEAYIIKEGRTVLGDGGGVCQVSTTLFRAILNAGLPIIERHAHAYRVGYYEQNSPVGLDATVFDPTADLKFKNDTPAYILIQASVDLKNKILTFELYGTSDERIATISKPKVWDETPPPPDLYQDDPTLPAGVIKQVDWKAPGAKVTFEYKVERNGEILEEKTFYSVYRPWQAVYLRGTGPTQP